MKLLAAALVAIALTVGTVQAAPKQIVIAPPPPPTPPSGVGPGLEFGFIIPNYSNTTFGSTQINNLCAALINATSGYPKNAIQCYINSGGVNNYPGGAVVVTGFLAWQNFPGSTATDQANAVSSRNSLLFSLQNGSGVTALSATFNGIALDCACNPFYADNNGNPQTINVAGIPFATCTTQAETGNSDTSGAVGLDNGKICPSGPAYIVAANPQTSSNLAGTGAGITCTKGNGGTFTCAATVELSTQVLNNLQTGQSISINLAGVSTGGTCTSAEQTANLAVLNAGTFSLTAVDANTGDQKTFSFTSNTLTCAGSGATFTVDASSGSDTFTITGAWSPLCDNSFSFYQANNALSSSPQPSIGYICPACQTTSGSNTILFTYAGANKGKYCSAFPLSNGVRETARSVSASLLAGSSCIKIGVETSGINAGQPDLTAPLPDAYSLSDVFPGLSNNIGTYSSQTTSTVAIDSQATVPCSTPQLSKAPTQGAVTGIVNKGTCNTASSFNNGGNNQNGIPSDTETCLALSTVVSSPIASPSPSPSSSPSPAPVPSPTAAPPSPVVPKPPPVSPTTAPPPPGSTLKCTYNGYYTISPAFAPCNTRYITFASPNNCSATAVTLNTKSQLGGKPVRIGWRLATSATGPVGVPNQITAQKGTCSARNLAGSIHSDGNLVLGGTHWTWQVVPAGKTSCTTVNLISQNRLADGSAFLNVAKTSSGACSNKFSWVSTNGGRAQFKLTKVSSAKSSGSG